MKNFILDTLYKPYPINDSIKSRVAYSFVFGLFVFLFLYIFKPFELNFLKSNFFTKTLGYGLVCFLVMLILNVFLYKTFPVFFSESKWTVKREIFWSVVNLTCIGLANFIYSFYFQISSFSLEIFIRFLLYTISIGFFPIMALVFINYNRLNSQFKNNIIQMNSNVAASNPKIKLMEDINIDVYSESGTIELNLFLHDFLFAKSADNYIELYYLNGNEIKRKLIRNTLKNLVLLFPNNNSLFRCHKSYVINLAQVNHLSGNAQGFKLHLKQTTEAIPVSRGSNDFIKSYFANRPQDLPLS